MPPGAWSTAGITQVVLGMGEVLQTNRAFDTVPVSNAPIRLLQLQVSGGQ